MSSDGFRFVPAICFTRDVAAHSTAARSVFLRTCKDQAQEVYFLLWGQSLWQPLPAKPPIPHMREQMNLDYLGDALDHWKGSLFEYLRAKNLLRDFVVDPMATDRERWHEADFSLFARLLRIGPDQIIRHEASLLARAQYFAEIAPGGDIFLDPDTGIATSGSSEAAKYVRPR